MLMGAAGESTKATGFSVDNSAVFNDDDSQYLIRENASNSTTGGDDARKKFTVSLWWKHGNIPSGGQNLFIQRNSSSNYMKCSIAGSGGNEGALQFSAVTLGTFNTGDTTAVLRDFHAWYHILFYYDSTDSTAGDRARIYLNGTRLTDFQSSTTNPSSGAITQFGSNNPAVIVQSQSGSQYGDGYMAEMVVIDGQALTPDNFTETDSNGVLRPLDISAQGFTFGDQGFYLPFTASGALGADYGTTRTAPSIAFLGSNSSTTNTTSSYTFSSQSLGAAASDRKIFVCASMSAHTVAALTFGTVTVGGVTATQLIAADTYPSPHDLHPMAIFVADVPSGTTGDIVLNVGSGSAANCGIALYRATACGEMFDSGSIEGSGSSSKSVTVQTPKGGFVLLHGNSNNEDNRVTLTNVTEDYDFAVEPDAGGNLGIFGGLNTSAASSDAVGLTTTAAIGSGSAFGQISISVAPIGDTSLKAVNSPTQSSDSPTKNYAVLSPLSLQANIVLSEGNLKQVSSSNSQGLSLSSFPVTTGQKVYIEATLTNTGGETGCLKATSLVAGNPGKTFDDLASGDARLLNVNNGDVFTHDGTALVSNYAPNQTNPTTHMIALDLVNDKIYWGDASVGSSGWSNGSGSYNQAFSSAVGVDLDANLDWFFAFKGYNATIAVNFGQTAFTVSPPTGYSSGYSAAIENENRETALTIEDGSAHFQATTYTGNGGSNEVNQSGNSTFQPDFVWLKDRAGAHYAMIDAVRGANKGVRSSLNFAEYTESNLSFDADGFSMTSAGSAATINTSSNTYIGWQWLAGNSTASNSNGSITSTVSVNQTAGFSIVSWTGSGANATIGHGLNAVPSWILIKNLADADSWVVYHDSTGATKGTALDTTGTPTTASTFFNDTAPTSTVFSVGSGGRSNGDSDAMIAYCWAEIPGFSKFGAFSSGSSGDPFVECGFTPALIFLKRISAADSWYVQDTARDPVNPAYRYLQWNSNAAEASNSSVYIDIISNGFVCDLGGIVTSSDDMIFGAWAENPFAGTTPATAR